MIPQPYIRTFLLRWTQMSARMSFGQMDKTWKTERHKSHHWERNSQLLQRTFIHPPPRAQVSLRGFNPVEKCTNCLMEARRCIRSTSSVLFVRLFLASVILHIFRRVRVSYSTAGPVTEHIAVLDGSVGSWTKNTNSQLAGYSKTKHNYFKNRQGWPPLKSMQTW